MVELVKDVDFAWVCRVYYEDTDGQGFLYHSRCMNFFERARTEWVRSLGVTQSAWLAKGLGFVVSKAELNYHKPAYLDDALLATVQVHKVGRTRISISQQLLKLQEPTSDASFVTSVEPVLGAAGAVTPVGGASPDLPTAADLASELLVSESKIRTHETAFDVVDCIVSGHFSIAFIDLAKGKPVAMPQQMVQALSL